MLFLRIRALWFYVCSHGVSARAAFRRPAAVGLPDRQDAMVLACRLLSISHSFPFTRYVFMAAPRCSRIFVLGVFFLPSLLCISSPGVDSVALARSRVEGPVDSARQDGDLKPVESPRWRRTVNGWEASIAWPDKGSDQSLPASASNLHPLVVAMMQFLLSFGALLLFEHTGEDPATDLVHMLDEGDSERWSRVDDAVGRRVMVFRGRSC